MEARDISTQCALALDMCCLSIRRIPGWSMDARVGLPIGEYLLHHNMLCMAQSLSIFVLRTVPCIQTFDLTHVCLIPTQAET